MTLAQTEPSERSEFEAPEDVRMSDEDQQDNGFVGSSFAELGVAADLIAVLARAGITTPTEVQVMTIPDGLAGRDVSGKAQTGSGKTLAFGLPLIERTETAARRRPRSLVLVPTRELANQVTETLAPLAVARKLWLCAIYGGVSMFRQIKALQAGVDLVVATPGRLNDLLERGEVSMEDVRTVVIDEADQMADMGFLPQVDRILARVEGAQVMLFSATLDGMVGALVRKYQHEPVRHEVAQDTVSVNTLEHRFIGVTAEEKVAVAAQICAGARRALVFVKTTHGADRLATQLGNAGLRTAAMHGRLAQGRRERTLAAFTGGETTVLVATNVAARGLHVDGLDVVLHYDLPEDAKTYVHRSGRTARAGEEGLAVTLCQPYETRDVALLQRDAGLNLRVVPMSPDDVRLLDLGAWEPPLGAPSTDGPRNARATGNSPQRSGGANRRPAARRPEAARGRGNGSWR